MRYLIVFSFTFAIALFTGYQWAKSELVCEHNTELVKAKVACTLTPNLKEIALIDDMYAVGDTIYQLDDDGNPMYDGLQFIVVDKIDIWADPLAK